MRGCRCGGESAAGGSRRQQAAGRRSSGGAPRFRLEALPHEPPGGLDLARKLPGHQRLRRGPDGACGRKPGSRGSRRAATAAAANPGAAGAGAPRRSIGDARSPRPTRRTCTKSSTRALQRCGLGIFTAGSWGGAALLLASGWDMVSKVVQEERLQPRESLAHLPPHSPTSCSGLAPCTAQHAFPSGLCSPIVLSENVCGAAAPALSSAILLLPQPTTSSLPALVTWCRISSAITSTAPHGAHFPTARPAPSPLLRRRLRSPQLPSSPRLRPSPVQL